MNEQGDYTTSQSLSNIKVYAGNGIKLIRYLPSKPVSQIMLTFPDPWPNENQRQWRIIQEQVVFEFERVLNTQNGMFLPATDAACFADWTQEVFMVRGDRWVIQQPPPRREWLPIVRNYEQKGHKEVNETTISSEKTNTNHMLQYGLSDIHDMCQQKLIN